MRQLLFPFRDCVILMVLCPALCSGAVNAQEVAEVPTAPLSAFAIISAPAIANGFPADRPFSGYMPGRYALPASTAASPRLVHFDTASVPPEDGTSFLLGYGATGRMVHTLLANVTPRRQTGVRHPFIPSFAPRPVRPIASAHIGQHLVVGFVWEHGGYDR